MHKSAIQRKVLKIKEKIRVLEVNLNICQLKCSLSGGHEWSEADKQLCLWCGFILELKSK